MSNNACSAYPDMVGSLNGILVSAESIGNALGPALGAALLATLLELFSDARNHLFLNGAVIFFLCFGIFATCVHLCALFLPFSIDKLAGLASDDAGPPDVSLDASTSKHPQKP